MEPRGVTACVDRDRPPAQVLCHAVAYPLSVRGSTSAAGPLYCCIAVLPQIDGHYGTEMSFRELLVQTVHAAEGWRAMGLGVGDVIALVSRNYHEVFPLTLGAVCAGVTVTCLVTTATTGEFVGAGSRDSG